MLESVLVADDDEEALAFSSAILKEDGFACQQARSGSKALELLQERKFDLVITDIVMPGATGFEVIRSAKDANPEAICIAMTSFGSLDSALDALNLGAYSYLVKPCDASAFRHCIQRGLEKQRLTRELRLRNAELEKLNAELDSKVQQATQELRELNRRILTEMASLREVDALKSGFLDNVSHDLRTPLASIKGHLGLLLDPVDFKLPKDAVSSLRSALNSATHMEYLISQLLEAARLTSGHIPLKLETVAVEKALQEAAALVQSQAEAGKIRLDVRAAEELPPLRADRGRLLQILSNLLGNACKFTPPDGRVTLRAWREEAAVHFCVEDTGIGIEPEHHVKIFDKFYQADTSLSKPFKGLGLGLHIVKELVALHGGKIWVESQAEKGSQFHFVIPLLPPR